MRHDHGGGANGGCKQLPKGPIGRAASVRPGVPGRKVKACINAVIHALTPPLIPERGGDSPPYR